MRVFRTLFRRCRTYNRPKPLQASGSRLTSTLARIAACGLIFSSAGFGAVFAFQSGLPHGSLFAGLMVSMAVSLELAKPLAVASAFTAFRSWAIVRGVLLAALAVVAIGFSLCAELQLVSSSRNTIVDGRTSAIEQSDVRRGQLKAAQQELAALPPSRPIEEVKADVTRLLAQNPRAGDCKHIDNPTARWVCPKVAALNGEAARTKRRVELQAVVDAKADQLATAGAVRVADPGSTALATYLATIGLPVPAGLLSDWLVLVPVLALELGAALALVLVQAVSGPSAVHAAPEIANVVDAKPAEPHQQTAARSGSVPTTRVDNRSPATKPKRASKAKRATRNNRRRLGQSAPASKEAVKLRLVDSLKAEGGKLDDASVRGVAKLIGAKKSTVHNAVAGLIASGVVAKVGTSLVLAAA